MIRVDFQKRGRFAARMSAIGPGKGHFFIEDRGKAFYGTDISINGCFVNILDVFVRQG